MLITTWNEADKVRHRIDVRLLCNGKQSPLIKQWMLSGGLFCVRKSCIDPVRFTLIEWRFPVPHFIEMATVENSSPTLVYIHAGQIPRNNSRLEIISPGGHLPAIYCRQQQGYALAIESESITCATGMEHVPPCCADSRRQLNEMAASAWAVKDHHRWLRQKWEWLSASLLHEAREGCRHFPIAARHRDKVRSVAERIYLRPSGNETIAELSKLAGISSTYLKKFFRQYYGQSIVQFRQYYRMQASCRLLSDTTIALQDIALACGFQDDSNFVRAFQRNFGVSPAKGMR